jgi:hypothetical protein
MRSYYEHLETASGKAQAAIQPKPNFRSSAIFPAIQLPGIQSRIIFMGYWMLKRNIREVAAIVTLRDSKGITLARQNFIITEAKTYRIELAEQLALAGISSNETFFGSLEIEFYSTANLVFPYPAVVINYYGPKFSTVVHVAQRIYNDYEDMKRNSQTDVPESGFNIYADEDKEPFISLINGGETVENMDMALEFYNIEGQSLKHTLPLGTLAPYETKLIFPAQQINLKDFLKGQVGAGKAKFHVNWIFPRLVVGNMQPKMPALMITHSYYDTTHASSPSDYWRPSEPDWVPASLIIPAPVKNSHFTNVYFYPIYSPANFALDVEIYSSEGKLLGSKTEALILTAPFTQLNRLNIKAICQELGISLEDDLGARINARPLGNSPLPARIKLGLDIGHAPQMPCNICTNLQPFNPPLESKPKTFRWAPVLTDQPHPVIWIMNSAPNINYKRQAEIELTFFHEQDETTIRRQLSLAPHGFATLYPNQDEELRTFFGGQVGWFTAISNNPYTTTYYLTENDSGLIGGDHGF